MYVGITHFQNYKMKIGIFQGSKAPTLEGLNKILKVEFSYN